MKKCTKCKIEKELSEFNKDKSRKDGLQPRCKSCVKQYNKQYYNQNADYFKRYKLENSDSIREHYKQYCLENPDKIIQKYHSKKDGLYHVYYLPDHNYVGTTDCITYRIRKHRSGGRNTDNYQILASFEDRAKALRFESLLHDSGFEGKHSRNSYK